MYYIRTFASNTNTGIPVLPEKIKNLLLITLGFVSLGCGAVGVLIPVLPTTPFVLLAALCFSTSSERFHRWLEQSPVFGQYIDNHQTKRGISLWLKVASIAFLWTGLLISMIAMHTTWAYISLSTVGIGVTIHLLLMKTRSNYAKKQLLNLVLLFRSVVRWLLMLAFQVPGSNGILSKDYTESNCKSQTPTSDNVCYEMRTKIYTA